MHQKIKVMVLNSYRDEKLKQPFFKPNYKECYDYLAWLGEKNGVIFYKSNLFQFDKQRGVFKNGWVFRNGSWKKVKKFKPDLVFDKGPSDLSEILKTRVLEKYFSVINNLDLTLLLDNKLYSYFIFPSLFAKTSVVSNQHELKRALKLIRGHKVVFKFPIGSGGFGVKILSRKQANQLKIRKQVLVQEFIDTSKGYKNLVKGVHDLRVFVINGRIIYAYFRLAKKGSFLSNIHQGGVMINIKNNQVPASVKKLIRRIDKRLKIFYPRILGIDFFFDSKGKPYLVELNTKPGIYFYPEDRALQKRVYLAMIKMFKEAVSLKK